jgi:hypothetical protein
MATHRSWRVELTGQTHTVEFEQTAMGRVRILVDEQPVVDEKPFAPPPRYELDVAGRPAVLHVVQSGVFQEYELEVAGAKLGRGVPARAKEVAQSERAIAEAHAREDSARARWMGFVLVVVGASLAAWAHHDVQEKGRYMPLMVLIATAGIPAGLAMLVLGEFEPRKDGDERPTGWKTKVIMGLAGAGFVIGLGIVSGLSLFSAFF